MNLINEEITRIQQIMGVSESDEAYSARYLALDFPRAVISEGEQQLIQEGAFIIDAIKGLLTSHRTAEFLTALTKWFYKLSGIDKDLDGISDKCDNESGECEKLRVQKLADFLHKLHHMFIEKINYIAAMIKFKKIKPSKEQIAQSADLGDKILKGIIIGFLILYMVKFGWAVASGKLLSSLYPALGVITKSSELSKKFDSMVSNVNSAISTN